MTATDLDGRRQNLDIVLQPEALLKGIPNTVCGAQAVIMLLSCLIDALQKLIRRTTVEIAMSRHPDNGYLSSASCMLACMMVLLWLLQNV